MKTLSVEAIEGILWALTAVVVLLTAGRFYMHWQKFKKINFGDIFNGLALIFLLAFMITWQVYAPTEFLEQLYAAGKISSPPTAVYNGMNAMKIDFANMVLFWCTLYSVKASFLALYWQIFAISERFRVAWSMITAYVVLSGLITILSVFWHCGSPTTLMIPAHCKKSKPRAITIMYLGAVLHIIGDILLMILPTMMIRKMRMRRKEKIGLSIVFALVLLDICFTTLRVVFTVNSIGTKVPDENTLWTSLDPIVTVLVCTLPCYRSLISPDRKKPIAQTSWLTSVFKSSSAGNQERNSSTEMSFFSTEHLQSHVATSN